MGLFAKRWKNRQERITSTILLSCLFIIALAVLIKQTSYDMRSFGVIWTVKTENADRLFGGVKIDMLTPAGFKPLLSGERYNRDTLYEKIDGKATLYLESGFKELFSQRFASMNDGSLWIELFIYNMGDATNAYAVYGQQKREDAKDIPGIAMSYRTANAAFMVTGMYYIEILGSTKSVLLSEAIIDMCTKIKAHLKTVESSGTGRISLTDTKYFVPGTDKLNLNSAFGYSAFKNVYTAHFRYNGSTATVFLSEMKSPDEARGMADGYFRFLIENGGELKKSDAEYGMKYISLYGSFEAVTSCGKYVAGVHEANTLKDADSIGRILMEKICAGK